MVNQQGEMVRPAHPPTALLLGITAVLGVAAVLAVVWVLGPGASSHGSVTATRALLVAVGGLVSAGLLIGVWLGKKGARSALFGVEVFLGFVVLLAAFVSMAAGSGVTAAFLLGLGTGVLLLLCALLVRSRPVRVWCEGAPWSPQPVQGALARWAQQRGWQVAWNVPRSVLNQLRGQPFHEYRRKDVPVLMRGVHRGAPAMALQIDFRRLRSVSTGPSYYSPGIDRQLQPSKTVERRSTSSIVVVELPGPVPELLVGAEREVLGDVEGLLFWNRSHRPFQGRAVGQVPTEGPAVALPESGGHVGDYCLFDADPGYAHAILTPQRATWLKGNRCGPVFFRLSGRKLAVWCSGGLVDVAVVDELLAVADEIASWIPAAAYRDPAGAKADQQHVPLAQLRIPAG
ncbi:hypothetical protein SAMN02982929_06269 [Saccharopolyspora kobensis]|uniref:Uncharacterized protein n=1 Tax=Saccharopolyspora kobensis TaxID=146035 RepID=A0A1H6ED99_9PSEU|nr:hypothetical protein [Saccharopolyspora kobensis]SEG95742.1 hypothetical protein SAMN02982929_06269 [Saccharopolyspora kobensis]SFD53638.1 hypothetical protein SAMN05216506_10516 [Saccharopolyspora kobensis]